MLKPQLSVFLSALAVSIALAAAPAIAQTAGKPITTFKVKSVIGLESVQHNTKGKATVSKDGLNFAGDTAKGNLPISEIEDVQTGADSQRAVGGTLGTLTMLAPYGSGRFLSLFRQKIDTLTIAYRDGSGGLHGAIFTLPHGQADLLKAQLVAAGAKASVITADTGTPAGSKEAKKQ